MLLLNIFLYICICVDYAGRVINEKYRNFIRASIFNEKKDMGDFVSAEYLK
jgi:hypothetical protein